jgi:hypothetical protein
MADAVTGHVAFAAVANLAAVDTHRGLANCDIGR